MSTLGFRPPIAVYLAHPDAAVRQAMTDDVAATGIHIVGASGDGATAVEQILDLAPDVALVAVDLPVLSGADLCRRLRHDLPVCRVVTLADNDDNPLVVDGLLAGAHGCHLLDDHAVPLARVIRGTMRGESLPTRSWAIRILAEYRQLGDGEIKRAVPAPKLTPTEQEVLNRLAAGTTIPAIAKLYDVTTHMVRLHAGFAIIKLYRALTDEQLVGTGATDGLADRAARTASAAAAGVRGLGAGPITEF